MIKILQGYAEIDKGSPEFHSHIMATFLYRGLDSFEKPSDLSEIVKIASKVTNMAQAGFGLFAEAEKHIKNCLFQ